MKASTAASLSSDISLRKPLTTSSPRPVSRRVLEYPYYRLTSLFPHCEDVISIYLFQSHIIPELLFHHSSFICMLFCLPVSCTTSILHLHIP